MSKNADMLNRIIAVAIVLLLFTVFAVKTLRYYSDIFYAVSSRIVYSYNYAHDENENFISRFTHFNYDVNRAVKGSVELYYGDLPLNIYFEKMFYYYLMTTNRNHFNRVTFLTDGRLMTDNLSPIVYLDERAENIKALSDYVKRDGTEFLFVRIPNKLEDNSVLPRAFSDNYIIENADKLYELINENDVDTLDLRAEMKHQGIDLATAFFDLDIHWTPETALWASGTVGAFINEKYGFDLDESVWDPERFERITFYNSMQGNEIYFIYGHHIFEDLTVFVPEYQTDIIKSTGGFEVLAEGDYISVFMPKVKYGYEGNIMTGDVELQERLFQRLLNLNASNDKSVLVIGDSFGLSLSPPFSLGFERLDFLYLITGHTHNFIWDIIDENDYDLVIITFSDAVVSQDDRPTFEEDRLHLGTPPER